MTRFKGSYLFLLFLAAALGLAAPAAHATFPGLNDHVVYRSSANQIFLDNGRQVTFPGFAQYDFSPAFSADGARIAFIRQTPPVQGRYYYQVMTVKPDGTDLREIANSSAFPGVTAFYSILEPAWTSNGHVSFIVRNGTADQNGIWMDGARVVPETHSAGQNWSPVTSELVYTCSFRTNKTDLCVYDAAKGQLRHLPVDGPGTSGIGLGFPKWTADGERILFQLGYTTFERGHYVERVDIFSINVDGSGLAKLTDSGPDICPDYPSTSGTSRATYVWQSPSPSPDGGLFATFRWTNVRGTGPGCPYSQQETGIYKVGLNGGGVAGSIVLDPGIAYGTDWQPVPVDLLVNIDDGHGNPLRGLKVELRTLQGAVVNDQPTNDNGGSYAFNTVPAGNYLVRATLVDNAATAPAFSVAHSEESFDDAAWIEKRITVPVGIRVLKSISFNATDLAATSVGVEQNRDRLSDMANIYFRTRQYVDWVKTHLTPDTGAKVKFVTFSENSPTTGEAFGPNDAAYFGSVAEIHMGTDFSRYSVRTGVNNEAPENGEWHEFTHHLYRTYIGRSSCARFLPDGTTLVPNHGGYANPDTCDSMDEGFSSFLPAYASRDIEGVTDSRYDHLWNLEENTNAWSQRSAGNRKLVSAEDKAVATLFWDLVDSNADGVGTQVVGADGLHREVTYTDRTSISLQELWAQMTSARTQTVFDLRKSFGTPALTIDLDGDAVADVAPVDEVFLMRGFFPIDTDQTIAGSHLTYHYDVGYSQRILPSAARNDSVGRSSHSAFTAAGIVTDTYIPRNQIQRMPGSQVQLTVQDATGKQLTNAQVGLVVQSGGQQTVSAQPLGQDALMYLEMPAYFDYLLPVDAPLPACDPVHDVRSTATLRVGVNGYVSAEPATTIDNCAYYQAVAAATGPSAVSVTATFPEDSTPPVSTVAASPTEPLIGGATPGAWKVGLSCTDPADTGFASGCARLEYRLDGGALTTYNNRVTVEGIGTHVFEYRGVDGAANSEAFRSVELNIVAGPPPTISGFAPASGPIGGTVTVTGANFDGTANVTISGASASFAIDSATQITATVPAGAVTGPITVTTRYGTGSSATSYSVIPPPTITGFTPLFANVGAYVTIYGTRFLAATAVSFNGTGAGGRIDSDTQITTIVPAGATTGPLTVTTPGGTATSPSNFVVTVGPPPSITSFSPASGIQGAAVTIKGTNLTSATAVAFNGTAATFGFGSKGTITATVPAGATTGPITVSGPGGWSTTSSSFVVVQPPSISGFAPASGPGGTVVTVSGANFGGTTSVKVGGSSAKFTVVSAGTITATVPRGAKSGPITVANPAGTATSATSFTLTK